MIHPDVIVVGAGLAGLTAAWQAAAGGKRVRLISKGWGAIYWHAGCIDVLGYVSGSPGEPVASPAEAVRELIESTPDHPYALTRTHGLATVLSGLQALCAESGYPLRGSLKTNVLLPTAVGAVRPTCLAPETMVAGDLRQSMPMLIVGFRRLHDFYPDLIADNLIEKGIRASGVTLNLGGLKTHRAVNGVVLARLFDQSDLVDEVLTAVYPFLGDAERVGFPAVLGLERSIAIKSKLEQGLGRPVFEIPTLPPSVPGMRLHRILTEAIRRYGGQVLDGMEVLSADTADGRVRMLYSEAAARKRAHRADHFVLATGGILGGGFNSDYMGNLHESILDLPLKAPANRLKWFRRDFLDQQGHPVYRAGVSVDAAFRPLDEAANVLYENLYAAGEMLAACDTLRERSLEGVALSTGYLVGKRLVANETG